MADLTKKLALFFESECSSLKELDVLVETTQKQKDWLDAVMLYRKGMIALQKNDIAGLESIKAANDALKAIVAKTPEEKTEISLKALNESIQKANKDNVLESIANIKLSFTPFYVEMKKGGFKEIMNESKFYEDENSSEVDQMDEDVLEGDTVSNPASTTTPTPAATIEPPPTPIEPAKEEPVAEACTAKESAYEKGFNEARKYWKYGESHKGFLKTVVEGTLFEKPYSWVKRYEEGFAAGYAYEEQYQRDINKELFEDEDTKEKA
jgi:hypothetical protein